MYRWSAPGVGAGWQTPVMHARSALFDVYGDHLRARGNQAPVAALVRMLDPVGIAAPAVRTAISRMVDAGLAGAGPARRRPRLPRHRARHPPPRRGRRPDLPPQRPGLGRHLAPGRSSTPPDDRSARTRLRADLAFVGYAELADNVWVSPFARAELDFVLERAGARARHRAGRRVRPAADRAPGTSAPCARRTTDWLDTADDLVARQLAAHDDEDEAAFAARFQLVHEWRKFLFADPGLPDELLPGDWPGRAAAELFAAEAARLKPGADRFVARCLGS